jgi:exonuclease 3'-5' domain-containing protein 1
MDQRCSSKAVNKSAQQDGPSVVAITSVHQLETLRQDLKRLPTKPPSIYLDASIVRQDELRDLQLLAPPTNTLYIIDIRSLGSTAMASVRDSSGSLRPILESNTIPKVAFDIRGLSRALFCHLNMSLDGM